MATHAAGPLHIGVTTSGNGCRLATRIRREIAASLPPGLGAACERIGTLRRRLLAEARAQARAKQLPADNPAKPAPADAEDDAKLLDGDADDDTADQPWSFNALVAPTDDDAAAAAADKARRVRWLSQICEYWPLDRLCALDPDEVLATAAPPPPSQPPPPPLRRTGRILLVGAGPGDPDMLTTAALRALQTADLVLADKLVPGAVLALVPRRTTVFIARKFPGNAEAAQAELQARALDAARAGLTVVRLKQGDPFIYGRGGEEFAHFARHGFAPAVLPGLTAALCAPLLARIPATHRAVSDQVLLCTGTGRRGAPPPPPAWEPTRTTVFLMALHRAAELVAELVAAGWPPTVPAAIVERASCPDQRVVRAPLCAVPRAVRELGSRPPGLLVVGYACDVLRGAGEGAENGHGRAGGEGAEDGCGRGEGAEDGRGREDGAADGGGRAGEAAVEDGAADATQKPVVENGWTVEEGCPWAV